jgi:uncharacterized membrane protein YidH (DUF202 family)
MYAVQVLLIATGLGIIAVDVWRWAARSRIVPSHALGGLEATPERDLFAIIFLIFGVVVTALGLIGFLASV